MKKVIIAGSRDITEKEFNRIVDYEPGFSLYEEDIIISGGARGVDTYAENLARSINISFKLYKADWEEYGKRAGYLRNLKMAEDGDKLIAIWDGKSKGTRMMIDIMLNQGKEVHVYVVRGGR